MGYMIYHIPLHSPYIALIYGTWNGHWPMGSHALPETSLRYWLWTSEYRCESEGKLLFTVQQMAVVRYEPVFSDKPTCHISYTYMKVMYSTICVYFFAYIHWYTWYQGYPHCTCQDTTFELRKAGAADVSFGSFFTEGMDGFKGIC